ncbi:MAG: membrane protein insertase YidC [Deltaproteobacteria bacterium]|nr:membrane protein insertase YidC [Deltaproteobacteria bacterium]
MEKNGLLAIVLCFLIFILWYRLFQPTEVPNQNTTQQESVVQNEAPQSHLAEKSEKPGFFEKVFVKKEIKNTLTIENNFYEALLDKESGGVISWKLKKYLDSNKKPYELIKQEGITPETITLGSTFTSEKGTKLLFPYKLTQQEANTLLFVYEDGDLKVEKKYEIDPKTYQIKVKILFEAKRDVGSGTLNFYITDRFLEGQKGSFFSPQGNVQRVLFANSESGLHTENLESIQEGKDLTEKLNAKVLWVGTDEQYFISTLVHQYEENGEARYRFGLPKVWIGIENGIIKSYLKYPIQEKKTLFGFSLFKGPKEMDLLGSVSSTLANSIDYGWFRFIAMPLLWVLKKLYNLFQNYGLAIILLTILVKLVLYPLTHTSFKSMREMQRIQPQMKKIREKYKDDKERLNKEIMQLMKSNKVNPMGGCLPMLLQMPVFIALYRVFGSSIELRGAPFIFWIQDLSMKDPYFITPILTGIVMFIQQKSTPTMGDPAQAKMMMMTPLIFSVILFWLPSGLTLYILCNTVLTFLQQYLINKKLPVHTA